MFLSSLFSRIYARYTIKPNSRHKLFLIACHGVHLNIVDSMWAIAVKSILFTDAMRIFYKLLYIVFYESNCYAVHSTGSLLVYF